MANVNISRPAVYVVCCLYACGLCAQEFRMEPRLSLGYEQSDNIFLSPETPQHSEEDPVQTPLSDTILNLTPGIMANLTGRRVRLSLAFDTGQVLYNRHSQLDSWRHNLRFTGETDLTPDMVLSFRDELLRTEDPLGRLQYEVNRDPEAVIDADPTALGLREPYTIHTAVAGLTHNFSDSDSILAEYSHSTRTETAESADEYVRHGVRSQFSYWNDTGWGGNLAGSVNQTDYETATDANTWSGTLKAGKKLTRTTEVFGQYKHDYVERSPAEAGSSRATYHVINPEAGFSYTSPRGGSLGLTAGFFRRERDRGDDSSGLSGSFQLTRPSERSSITLYAATGHNDSLHSRKQVEASTFYEAGVNVGYNLARTLNLSIFTSYRHDNYDEIDEPEEEEPETAIIRARGDGDSMGAGLTLAYQPRSWCSLQLSYSFRDRSSERPEDEYQENRASIMLRLSAPYHVGSLPDAPEEAMDI